MRYVVFVFLALILSSLGSALYYMVRSKQTNPKVVWSLTLRVALSVTLFLMLMIGYKLGWIDARL
ncbi:MAG TPA: twin transmembrane helix small protein [Rhodocyclaceae bacterium]|nr:twin transmembrane helix small protein [Rhodocyclaceae bacterium]